METNTVGRYVQGASGRDYAPHVARHNVALSALPRTMTITCDPGSNGHMIARMLADKMKVEYHDGSILDAIVIESKMARHLMERLDERHTGLLDDAVYSILSGHPSFKDDYLRYLNIVLHKIVTKGGIIMGHGAHLILDIPEVLHVRIIGSRSRCILRMMKVMDISQNEARKLYEEILRNRAQYIIKQFGSNIDDPELYDIVINTDYISAEYAVRNVLSCHSNNNIHKMSA